MTARIDRYRDPYAGPRTYVVPRSTFDAWLRRGDLRRLDSAHVELGWAAAPRRFRLRRFTRADGHRRVALTELLVTDPAYRALGYPRTERAGP